ncbi:MAG: toprim domain-containing protein, partial [Rhodocyclaceae bacterium]|nr:toprim domain-containing protein [Rhodocyclaceae bacterium]
RDKNGATVVLPVSLTAKGKYGTTINLIKTGFGKTYFGGDRHGEPFDHWFWKMVTEKNAARYIDEQRFMDWLKSSDDCERRLGYIRDSFPFGHTNAHGRTIYRKKDLRKFQEELAERKRIEAQQDKELDALRNEQAQAGGEGEHQRLGASGSTFPLIHTDDAHGDSINDSGAQFSLAGGASGVDAWAIKEEFANACREHGLIVNPEDIVADGRRHRVQADGDTAGKMSASYRLFLDGKPAGNISNFKTSEHVIWVTKQQNAPKLTREDRQAIKEKEERREIEEAQRHEAAAQQVARWLQSCPRVLCEPTPYMRAKRIQPHDGEFGGLRTDKTGQSTYIPIHDANGKVWSYQKIYADGRKMFAGGSQIAGNFHAVGGMAALDKASSIVIAEGYATAASLSEVLEQPTVAALNAGNLRMVACVLRQRYPDKPIVIAGDDDYRTQLKTGHNTGREKAQVAAAAVGGIAVFPEFAPGEREGGLTDFNDLLTKSRVDSTEAWYQVHQAVAQAQRARDEDEERHAQEQRLQAALYRMTA